MCSFLHKELNIRQIFDTAAKHPSMFFRIDQYLDFTIISVKNAASDKYLVQKWGKNGQDHF